MTIEIVDFPIKNGGSFHSYVNVYQRVIPSFQCPKVLFHCSPSGAQKKAPLFSTPLWEPVPVVVPAVDEGAEGAGAVWPIDIDEDLQVHYGLWYL